MGRYPGISWQVSRAISRYKAVSKKGHELDMLLRDVCFADDLQVMRMS